MSLPTLIQKALGKPPHVVARRAGYELRAQTDRLFAARRERRFDERTLLEATRAADLDSLWERLGRRPYPAHTTPLDPGVYEELCPGDTDRIQAAAKRALDHSVRLLGVEPLNLDPRIDWSKDYRSGYVWPARYVKDIRLANQSDASDVKFPWELSRLQWLLPVGQAHLLGPNETYAEAARGVLEDWISANPLAHTVNWACAMEAALRILSWTWLFRVFHTSRDWSDPGFRARFLSALYLHADFTERHLEWSDVNGNHLTADAAGLVFAGLFFGEGRAPTRWQHQGWRLLCDEILRQVHSDGVDFEASTAYHRLVLELFLLSAFYREVLDLGVPEAYRDRLVAMARFAAAYSRPDGSSPLWGDADDARALPLGGQYVNDHRYLPALVGAAWGVPDLMLEGPQSELVWLLGPGRGRVTGGGASPASTGFPQGGVYIMRSDRDHVFIDCGPVGLAGRGGHGHNDCLSFEAVLDGVSLVTDCGTFTYTGSVEDRNAFRSTRSHNTPQVDGAEINRFVRPDMLWSLRDDARPQERLWRPGPDADAFCGSHTGFERLAAPVTPVRTLVLDRVQHALVIHDAFEGHGEHEFEIPLHLAPGVAVAEMEPKRLRLLANGREFLLAWDPASRWELRVDVARISPSYGVSEPTSRLSWLRSGTTNETLTVCLLPAENAPSDLLSWAHEQVRAVLSERSHAS